MTLLQLAQPGSVPQQSPSQMFRASDGSVRIDSGPTSVITNPLAQQMIVLVHPTMEAHVLPLPPGAMPQVAPPALSVPGMPALALPALQPTGVVDLGKSIIEGHAVTGKQFTFAPPAAPTLPGMPQAPQAPALPGRPQAPALPGMPAAPAIPGAPGLPGLPPPPTVVVAWTSIATQLPVLTTVTGPFGTQTCRCNTAPSAEPSPSLFQVPPGYRPAGSPLPQGSLPQAPSMPQTPSLPPAPSLPQAPSLAAPQTPSVPQGPSLPKFSGFPQ
jgi:hypothetical protein